MQPRRMFSHLRNFVKFVCTISGGENRSGAAEGCGEVCKFVLDLPRSLS